MGAPTQRERLIKPLMQELNGTLPGKASSLGVILRAILLEEPMFGPRIRIEGDRPPRSLERLLDRRGRLAAVEVGGERHEASLREPVADLPKRLRQSPPRMQDHHTWSAAMLGNGQIGADRSPISLKFSHTALLKHSRNAVLQ